MPRNRLFTHYLLRTAVACAIVVGAAFPAKGQSLAALPPAAPAATVDGTPILVSDLVLALRSAVGPEVDVYSLPPAAFSRALEVAIDRRLVYEHVRRSGYAADEGEIERAVGMLEEQLELRNRELHEHLIERHMGMGDLKNEIAWKLSWRRFAQAELTEETLRELAVGPLKEYDGRRRRVSHILFRDEAPSAGASPQLVQLARAVREEILGGLRFAEAAAKYSQAPSSGDGGDLGWINREGPMVEGFSAAAFALPLGEVSEPIVTEFGVHLIQCTDEEPANEDLEARLPIIRIVAERRLFAELAKSLREKSEIRYEGVIERLPDAASE